MIITTQIMDSTIKHDSLNRFNNQTCLIEIIKYYPKRSIQSNRYYWAVLNQIVEYVSEYTGYTTNELHQSFKEMFLKTEFINVITGEMKERTKSTTELNSKEFSEYVDKVIKFIAEFFKIEIKTPQEYFET